MFEYAPSSPPPPERWVAVDTDFSNPYLLTNDNYRLWRKQAMVRLRAAEVWPVVSGADPEPTTGADPHDNWKRKNKRARSLLLQMVSEEFIPLVCSVKTANEAWTALQVLLDDTSPRSIMHSFSALLDLRKPTSTSWTAHVLEFENRWRDIYSMLSDVDADASSKSWIQGLKMCFEDSQFKAQILLRTAPELRDYIVLRTIGEPTYDEVLDIIATSKFCR